MNETIMIRNYDRDKTNNDDDDNDNKISKKTRIRNKRTVVK